MKRPFFILFFSILYVSSLIAQERQYNLNILPEPPIKIKSLQTEFKDSTKINAELNFFESKLKSAGYINAQRVKDTLELSTRKVVYNYGDVWKWSELRIDQSLLSLMPKTEFKTITNNGQIVNPDALTEYIEQALKFAENHGYPFAEIAFDSISIADNKVNAKLIMKLNALVKFDTLNIVNKKAIHPSFLNSYLSIKQGDVYDERKVIAIQNRVDELGFIRLKYPARIYFNNNYATIVLSPEKRNANKFDGLIGVQPNGAGQKTAIVGQAQLYLVNVIGRGEKASVDFRSQANETRDLKIMLNYPFVFSTSFGLAFNLDIRRQDTSFSILGRGLSVQYLLKGNNQISLNYKVTESNLLSVKKYQNTNVLPENLDVNRKSYGISSNFENLDYRINPRKGYSVFTSLMFGTRRVERNGGINDSLYNSIELSSTQIQLSAYLKKFISIKSNQVLLLSYKTEWLESNKIFNNEMIRIGGINDLRGFDEESIFTSYYWVGTLEYRFLLDRNSFVRLFFDQAYYFNKALNLDDYPYGLGLGVQLQTVAGMLQLNYALGAQANTGINLQTGKIHFGIINYF